MAKALSPCPALQSYRQKAAGNLLIYSGETPLTFVFIIVWKGNERSLQGGNKGVYYQKGVAVVSGGTRAGMQL